MVMKVEGADDGEGGRDGEGGVGGVDKSSQAEGVDKSSQPVRQPAPVVLSPEVWNSLYVGSRVDSAALPGAEHGAV